MARHRLSRSLAASTDPILEDRDMHSQLSYAAVKLEIADRQRRAERELSCGQLAKSTGHRCRSPLARLVTLLRTAPAAEMASSKDAA
jgi:hypothetical protein